MRDEDGHFLGKPYPGTDWEGLGNLRDWLQAAVEKAGATMTGGGVGCGGADLDIELEGMPYSLSIRPMSKTTEQRAR